MTAPIYFNVPRVCQYLQAHRVVYTLRRERSTGVTKARVGSYFKYDVIGTVRVVFVARFTNLSPDSIRIYTPQSSFKTPEEWLDAAHQLKNGLNDVDCLYRVEMVD